MKKFLLLVAAITTSFLSCGDAASDKNVVNIYTHRHYKADDKLFSQFTEETGIKVNIVNASADELIQRLETEGEASKADVLITVDAGRLYRAQEKGLLQPISSEILEANIGPKFREKDGYWYGMTYRARIIAYAKDRVDPEEIKNYEDLTDPKWKGKVLIRSSENIYNQSLLASIIVAEGEEGAKRWAEGMVANMARNPKGSDRDQVKAVASGEGDIAVVNTYYIGLMLNDGNEEERKAGETVGIIFPDQEGRGTHINISGMGVTKYAPNKENAIKLMEFLSSESAQQTLANLNYEYPINPKAAKAAILKTWGDFKADSIDLYNLGKYNSEAVKIFDHAGWK
ncbi:MAG TPA: Fe(3+) ABC transporter substrate-binding protein [Arenibacter sp.]|nr:Fe(3+) ABC transporter substrate-binding protein [Arenibacter sp.]